MEKIRKSDVAVRRPVAYTSADAVLAEAERLAAAGTKTTGNWSLGEIIDHLATGVDLMIEGFNYEAPWYIRLVGRMILKRRILSRSMPPRLPFPGGEDVRPFVASIGVEDALSHLRAATERMKTVESFAPHPVFGLLTREEIQQLHLRHAELHLSFTRDPGAPTAACR